MQLSDSGRFNVTSKMFGDGKLMRECWTGGGGVVNWEAIFGCFREVCVVGCFLMVL